MADGFKIATAYVLVEPDTDGFDEKVEADLEKGKAETKVKVAPDTEGFEAKLDAELAKNKAEAKVKLNPDDADFKAKMKAAIDAVGEEKVKLGIDQATVDRAVAEAKAKLDEFAAEEAKPKVSVDDDEFKAKVEDDKTKLDELDEKKARPKVELDDGDFKAKAAEDGAAAGEAGGHMSLMAAAIASIAVAAPGAGALLGGLAGAGATVGLAFRGVKQALTDYSAAQSAVGQNAAQVAQTEFANATAIKAAEQGIADARRAAAQQAISSAEAVVNAEQGLQNAEISEQFAQIALTQARKDAALTLQQLNDEEKDSKLSVEAATLALQQAQINARQIDQSNVTTALQRAQANLAVEQAQQALREAQEKATNSTNAANLANKQGVEGNPSVVQAKNAERLAVQGIGNAQQSLGDAVRNAANSQVSSQEAVTKAIQNLADTQKNQQLQAAVTAASNAQAATQFARDMAKMTGAGRTFVTELLDVKSNIKTLSATAQTAFLPGVTAFLKGAQTLMPIFNTEAKTMGGILGGQFSAVGQALRSANIQGEIKTILGEGNQLVSILGPALGKLGSSLLQFFSAGAPVAEALAKGLSAIVGTGLPQFFKALEPGMKGAAGILAVLGQAISSLGTPLGEILSALENALAPALKALLPGFTALVDALGPLLSAAVQMLSPWLTALATTLSNLAVAARPILNVITELFRAIGNQLAPVFALLARTQGEVLKAIQPLFGLLGPLAGILITLVKDALGPVATLIKDLAPIIVTLVKSFVSFAVDALKPVMPMISQLAGTLGKVLTSLVPLLPPLVQFAATLAEDWLKALTPMIPKIMTFVEQLIKAGEKALPQLLPQIQQLAGQFNQMLTQLMPMLPGLMQLSTVFLDLAVKSLPVLLPIMTALIKGITLIDQSIIALDRLILDGLMAMIKSLGQGFKEFDLVSKKAWSAVTKYLTSSTKETWQSLKQWWSDVQKIYNDGFSWLKNIFTTVTNWLYNTLWKNWLGSIKTSTLQLWTDIRSGVTTFFSDLGRIFGSGISALGTIWQRLEGVFKSPVNFLISKVYMDGIRRLWDDVAGAIGLSSINLPVVATLNAGGVVPGPNVDADVVPALLTPGERVLSRTQVGQLGGHDAIDAMVGRSTGGPNDGRRFSGGGIIGDIGGFLSGVWDSAKFLASFAGDPVKAVEGLLDKAVSTSAKGELGQMMTKLPEALIAKLAGYAKANAASGGAAAMVTTAKSYLGKGDIFSAMVGRPVEEWCADYVDAIAKITGNSSVVPSTASAPAKASMFHDAGEFHSGIAGAQPGDIFFASHGGSGDIPGVYHTGIITAPSTGQSLISIAGNTGGNDVAMENWSPGEIAGFGRPKYLAGSGSYTGGSLLRPSPSDAQGWARQNLEKAGQGGQFPSLLDLWNRESGWRWDATNPSSGAYGIPQSLPASKMASAGSDWMDNAATQIKWGLDYIAGRYGNPAGAVAHENAYGWYDQGGYLPTGRSNVVNATGKPEAVLTPQQTAALVTLADILTGKSGGLGRPAVHQEINFHGKTMASPEELAALSIHLQTAIGNA